MPMPNTIDALLLAFELHDAERIRAIVETGFNVHQPINSKSPVATLIEMYTRSDRFAGCLRVMLDHGAVLDDPCIAPVLCDDPVAIEAAVRRAPTWLQHRTSLNCAFTPLDGASLLHVAAEYGHLAAATKLIGLGVEVDAKAATDAFGMNGHTALFHTVNSHANRSAPIMELLLAAGARADIALQGIVWGKGCAWETTCLDVTPISYAQWGLTPQMHREECDIYFNVRTLLKAAGRPIPPLDNVPNRYLVVDRLR